MKICDRCEGRRDVREVILQTEGANYIRMDLCVDCRKEVSACMGIKKATQTEKDQ